MPKSPKTATARKRARLTGVKMADLIPFTPNHKTAERLRAKRQATKQRLIEKIGINHDDAPLFDEYINFMVHLEMTGRK